MPALIAALLFLALIGRPIGAGAQEPARFVENPLEIGTLPNGLTYAVLRHDSPKGDIGLRLIVQAGALDERDDELGFAHFVEHMAFSGTRHHPPGSIRNFFERLGLKFGADLNATTSFADTQYFLDVPEGRIGQLDDCLRVLRDYADGLLFPPEEVKRESGVVVSELKARDGAGRRTAIQMLQTVYKGTLLARRDIGGDQEQLERATAEKLRAFYQRHYQPQRMTVLLAGPLDSDIAIQKITAAFGSMAVPVEKVAPASIPMPVKFEGIKPDVVVIPTFRGANVRIGYIGLRPPDFRTVTRQVKIRKSENLPPSPSSVPICAICGWFELLNLGSTARVVYTLFLSIIYQ